MDRFRSGQLTFPVIDRAPDEPSATAETVVLLHGFPQAATSWEPLIPALTAAGYRVLAPYQRGYARGAQPRGRRAYGGEQLVADVVALLDTADLDKVHLVGHDWGGFVAWALAAHAPQRLHSLSVLSTPHPAAMTAAMLRSSQLLRSWYMLFFQLPWLPERLLDPARPAGRKRFVQALTRSGLDPAAAARDAQELADAGALTYALNWYRAMPFTLTKPIGKITVPTRYVWSSGDIALGRKAAELTADHVTGPYTFREINASHWIQGEVADLLLPHLATYRGM